MENFRTTLHGFEQAAEGDALALLNSFSEYTESARKELQNTERTKLQNKHASSAKLFIGRVEAKLRDVEKEITQKRYPLHSSRLDNDKLRGALEFNAAMQVRDQYPANILRQAYSLQRTDLASALEDRVSGIEPKTAEAQAEQLQFSKVSEEYHKALGITELEEQIKELRKVLGKAQIFKKRVELDFSVTRPKTWQEHLALMQRVERA